MIKPLPHSTLFTLLLLMSPLLAISANNLLIIWTALELNLLSLIPLILLTQTKKEGEAAIKYFLAQALGSSLLLISFMSLSHAPYFDLMSSLSSPLMSLSILMKLGAAPAHFWFPAVMVDSSWPICLALTTWQKIAPLSLLTLMFTPPQKIIILFSMISALLGGVMGLNQTQINSLLAFSSISHLAWLIPLSALSTPLTLFYFFVYSMTLGPLIFIFYSLNLTSLRQMPLIFPPTALPITLMLALLLSLGGLPPLLGFTPKLLALKALCSSSLFILFPPLILGSAMSLAFYLNIFFITCLYSTQTSKTVSPTASETFDPMMEKVMPKPYSASPYDGAILLLPLFLPLFLL